MENYIKRMFVEREDLQGKIKRAKSAVANDSFRIDQKQKELLKHQIEGMEIYLKFLNYRIDYDTKRNKNKDGE